MSTAVTTPRSSFLQRFGWLPLFLIGGAVVALSFLVAALVGVLFFGGLLLVAVLVGVWLLRAARRGTVLKWITPRNLRRPM